MRHLDVDLILPDGSRCRAGEIVVADPDPAGRLRGQFRYTPEWISDQKTYALDPTHLPLSAEIFEANRPQAGVHGIFEDALPGAWGNALLVRLHQLPPRAQRVPDLLACLGEGALGALRFVTREVTEAAPEATLAELPDLVRAAEAFERGEPISDPVLTHFLRAGSTAGGMRPKALISDSGIHWIAKKPSIQDRVDVVRIEGATLALARMAGLPTVESRIETIASRAVLLVKRFDISPEGGRYHMASLQTLMRMEGFYTATWEMVAKAVRAISADPQADARNLYRQFVFGALVGNTDDHLKNLTMVQDGTGWRLSLAYDLNPDLTGNREHVLGAGAGYGPWARRELLDVARAMGYGRRQDAACVLDEVVDAVVGWKAVFAGHGVPSRDIERFVRDIEDRLHRAGDIAA